jgi:ABC-type Mn2+/Zn2+ transport system permease subunit
MRPLHAVGAVASFLLALVGIFFLWKVTLFRRDVAICILALTSAFGLNLSLYVFHLRGRIAALEQQLQARK